MFEASPRSSDVLATEEALQWDFPGAAVSVPSTTFAEESFQESLAGYLQQCSTESIKRFAARASKAGSLAVETRDTSDPAMIASLLLTLLEVHGRRVPTTLLRKRVRDNASWAEGSENPWRRLPFWLVLRVGLARHLANIHDGEIGRLKYKFLICLVLTQLLDNTLNHLDPQSLATLKAKLSRRLAKLEDAKAQCSPRICSEYDALFASLGPIFRNTLRKANQHIETVWAALKAQMKKHIPPLPVRAPQTALHLALPNSGPYLHNILQNAFHMDKMYTQTHNFNKEAANQSLKPLADRCYTLSQLETEVEDHDRFEDLASSSHDNACMALYRKIDHYVKLVGSTYDGDPEQKSIMILTLMDLWMALDQRNTSIFELLLDFRPGILPEVLDVLQLPHLSDMRRLQRIQRYLHERNERSISTTRTIFDNPSTECFAVRYFDESDPETLGTLYQEINRAEALSRAAKEMEWEKSSKEYEDLEKRIAESTCVFKQDEPYPEHDDKRCTKCYLRRCARRTTIAIHEDFLPADSVHAKAAVFELRCPPAFAAYRNATWKIIGVLGRQKLVDRSQPRLRLQEYSNLSPFTQSSIGGITLASTTKSFLDTHYRVLRFPVGLSEVCKPNGLKLAYFDAFTKMWPGLQRVKPSFAHHCPLIIPPNSSFAVLRFPSEFASDGPGRTSNEIISSHTLCPSGLNPYEYMSFQSLFSGKHRRWPLILLELASSNLNFGNEATSILISQLSAQAGPAHENDPLRTIHHIFRHESFCKRLVDQINERVRTTSVNWRETNCMDMLITLILRLLSLTSDGPSYDKASALLTKVRAATYGWTHQLREEIHNAKDGDTSRICSRYALWAALLCRKTFSRHSADPRIGSTVSLSVEELKCFIVSSITLQDNMITDPATMPSNLRAALIRDLKMTYRMRFLIQQSVKEHYQGLFAAIDSIWPQPSPSGGRTYSEPIFLNGKHCWVVQLIAQGPHGYKEQMVHYDILEGHLLIDNKPLGRLPTDIRTSPILAELFGSQNLLTYPSGLLGMAYRVSLPSFDHEVHIGFRGEQMIIRDYFQGKLWELIPRGSFARGNIYDLPALLVDDSFHWLDLNSGILHIRPCAAKWKPKDSNWQIDLKTHIGTRRSSRLVDPHSPIFRKIANIFEGFEDMRFLTVYQPRREPLSVELRRLQLTFKVSKTGNGSLCCNELNAEVDRNQDAGTWYGLSSKLVLCDTLNLQERIIVVPMGSIRVRRNKFHVVVSLDQNGYYAKYSINQIIGRLDCPAEPRMLYLKAQLHAYTSSVVPDSLTGRTGTEESLHFLQSGICQPWEPLDLPSLRYLASIADLTPTREYYPKGLKVMQSTHWNPTRTTIMQRDEFLPLVQSIYQKSLDLVRFSLQRPELPKLSEADVHLLQRGIYQRQLYERQVDYCRTPRGSCDLVYDARDGFQNTQEYKNVFEAVTLISKWSTRIPAPADLAEIFQAWPIIQGYGHSYGKILLSDCLSTDFALDWGSLVEYCRGCTQAQLYHLSFMFAILSFSADVNMDVIRTLIAFAISNNMKKLNPPTWPSYSNFRHNHVPTADSLAKLMESCVIPHKEENYRGLTLTFKMKQKFEVARRDHEEKAEKNCKRLAVFLLEQWPCVEPTIDGLSDEDSLELDVPKTLAIVKPEWLRLFQNLELSKYITQIQQVLKHFDAPFDGQPLLLENDEGGIFFPGCGKKGIPHLMTHLLCKSIDTHTDIQTGARSSTLSSLSRKENIPVTSKMQSQPSSKTKKMPREMVDLFNIIGSFSKTKSTVMKDYTSDLKQSLEALKSLESRPRRMENNEMTPVELIVDIAEAQQKVEEIMMRICQAFEKDDRRAKWLKEGGLWPCITRVTLLEQLRSTSTVEFGSGMKEILVEYALSLTQLQRIMRLREANRKNNNKKFEEEKSYAGHENWQPASHPDWVLLEIEANILIRPGQVDVALATISPTSGSNSVLQMNMGQGKTSCIIPMVAASLADTNRLVRVVVPKALLLQTAQLLHARLGGLLGRELRHIPFSRKTPTDQETTKAFLKIHKDMMSASGIMISLPEHIMSFMLSGMQRVSDNRIAEATSMINIQGWMRKVCRDVLDESDFTLAVKTQLIYPSGQQTTVDGQPRRWEIPETLLGLVEKHIWSLKREYPRSLDVVNRPVGGFPLIYFLRKDAEDALISLIVNDIMRGHTSILPMQDCSTPERQAIRNYIITAVVRPRTMTMIDTVFPDKPIAKQTLHLLRGLLVNRILLLTLKKRWSVQYGLHPMRDPVAVPFHAKGVPSDQAEWGHPDVAILFTCLSFYYGGLTISQLQQGLEHVVKSDDPSSEYDRWMQGVKNIPDSLREWNVINVDDEAQLNEVWKCLRYSTVAIDYYLNHFVFPRHARQFKIQLQSSAWDIPLLPNVQTSQWKSSEHRPLTTGFSGTNDSRSLLPLTIKQQDLPRLSHTNAEVLTYLLQPRNRQYIIAAGRNGKRLSEKDFLYKLKEVKIRILIDAGAQILEMDNHTLVRTWLEVDTEAKAALFFTDENQPLIMYRNNKTIPLVASPFADDLKECLVYLDEAHTRGTDLRLGPEAKGALTLGLGQSKDQTVQGMLRPFLFVGNVVLLT